MEIKKGKIYLCTDSLIMSECDTEELTEGKLYKSDNNDCITSNSGNTRHSSCEKYLTDKIVVNCLTQSDWDYVTEKLWYKWSDGRWGLYLENTCISLNGMRFSAIDLSKKNGYHIVSIDTFKELFPDNFKEEERPKTDSIVTQVTDKFKDRSDLGIEKYNTTLQDNTDGVITFLNHLQEELMDATLYIQKLKNQFDELKSKL